MSTRIAHTAVASAALSVLAVARPQSDFVHWETPHVHPLELSADGSRLFAVDTPDDRLEVFDATSALVRLFDVPVGLDPVSVRERIAGEVWVVNHVSDTVSVVDLASRAVIATLATDDEPCDVVFAGSPERAFVSCSQANSILVFDPSDLSLAPQRIALAGEDPRALAVSVDGSTVYAAIFESGNRSTVLGGGIDTAGGVLGFPPNVVGDAAGPYLGVNPPPNLGVAFEPPLATGLPVPPKVGLIVKKDDGGRWMDDNGGDWTELVSGANASLSGRPVGWDLYDHDLAMIDAGTLAVRYQTGLMNACMALAVNPRTGRVTVVGTDGINEVRFEPNLSGRFLRVLFANVEDDGVSGGGSSSATVVDLNPHLDYSQSTIGQSQREKSLGDPRGIVWNDDGSLGLIAGMGSNNVVLVNASGSRAGVQATIDVGEGPTGVALDSQRSIAYVLNKFESSISIVNLANERELARIGFHDPSPSAIKVGRKHLYDTHANSGLGHVACASCHLDARNDRLAWDLGDPQGALDLNTDQNIGAGIPGLGVGPQPFHPMKGPMTTQTLQDIIGHEPLHWRGDRDGLEAFNGAFIGLQGDDANLSPTQMQEFEDFLATISIPPNPYRKLDNGLPTDLPLPGHLTTGRFLPAGQPLPNGDATRGLSLYRPPKLLDGGAVACATCHTLPTGTGTGMRKVSIGGNFQPIAPGPNGELHHMLVTVDGSTNRVIKVPQLRTLYDKVGFDMLTQKSLAGFGLLHDGSIDTIARFVAEPVFNVQNDQEVADLVAFLLAFSGSDLPMGAVNKTLEPPGTVGRDTHAAVGRQLTVTSSADPVELASINALIALADADEIGLVARVVSAGSPRGYAYDGVFQRFQADRASEVATLGELLALASPSTPLTITSVPRGSETRIAIDRDRDAALDRDELDAATDPADGASLPGGCVDVAPHYPLGLLAVAYRSGRVRLTWTDASTNEQGFLVERSAAGANAFATLATLPPNATLYVDTQAACEAVYDYRVRAFNCATSLSFAVARITASCGLLPFAHDVLDAAPPPVVKPIHASH